MTIDYEALWAEIQANPACAQHIHTNDMPKISADEARAKDAAIADILNQNRVRLVYREVGEGGVSEAMGVPAGPLFIKQLREAALATLPNGATQADIERKALIEQAWRLLDKAALNVGSAKVRAGIDAFVEFGLLDAAGATAVKKLAEVPDHVSINDVSRAVRGPRGGE